MEAVKLQSSSTSADEAISPAKQQMIRNQKNRVAQTRRFISSRHKTENFITTASTAGLIHGGGMFLNHPPFSVSSSLPPPASLSQLLHPHGHLLQPPLLPLPVSRTFHALPTRGSKSSPYGHPLCPTNRKSPSSKINKPREQTSKKQSPLKQKPGPVQKVDNLGRKQEHPEAAAARRDAFEVISGNGLTMGSMKRFELGDPDVKVDEMDMFSGMVFSLSPPPSSLPLPKFSLRPKVVSCTIEAVGGGVDTGATDNLCRLLKLR
ncbi:hypothetical protein Ancab_016762 [Ancistrocladus abbreviatus]